VAFVSTYPAGYDGWSSGSPRLAPMKCVQVLQWCRGWLKPSATGGILMFFFFFLYVVRGPRRQSRMSLPVIAVSCCCSAVCGRLGSVLSCVKGSMLSYSSKARSPKFVGRCAATTIQRTMIGPVGRWFSFPQRFGVEMYGTPIFSNCPVHSFDTGVTDGAFICLDGFATLGTFVNSRG